MNEHHEGFLKILGELTETENRLKATETYQILDEITNLYIKDGKVSAYIKMNEINKEKKLTTNNYKDLIDIFFYENKLLFKNPKDQAIIDLIELFSGSFGDDALDYLERFAYNNCDEQPYALSILLLLAKIEKRQETTLKNIKMSFNSFDDKTKDFVVNYSSALFPDRKINFASNNLNFQKNSIEYEDEKSTEKEKKKWWEFWK